MADFGRHLHLGSGANPSDPTKSLFFQKRLFRRVFVEIVGLEPVFGVAEKL
jgi:hypothetical protein